MVTQGVLTCTEVALREAVDKETVRRWCRMGRLRAFKLGNEWLIREEDLPQAVESK